MRATASAIMEGMLQPGNFHYGRSFKGPGPIEASCPCPKEVCGLVMTPSPECDQHPFDKPRTIRILHQADRCPGKPMERVV